MSEPFKISDPMWKRYIDDKNMPEFIIFMAIIFLFFVLILFSAEVFLVE